METPVATPFVYRFLGNVNLFHGRINEGQTYLHDHATHTRGAHGVGDTVVYVRPHFLEIRREPNGAATFRATTRHINAAGPLVKVEAVTEWGGPVQVEMSQDRFRELRLTKNDEVFIIPKEVKVFRDNA